MFLSLVGNGRKVFEMMEKLGREAFFTTTCSMTNSPGVEKCAPISHCRLNIWV